MTNYTRDRQEEMAREAAARRNGSRRSPKGLSVFRLKIIGLILLFIGTLGGVVGIRALTFAVVCQIISWVAYPIYAWLLVEGAKHTSSTGKYFLRLLVLAIISEVPYDLAHSYQLFNMYSQNPVWGLLVCLITLAFFKYLSGSKNVGAWLGRVLIVIAGIAYMLMLGIDYQGSIVYGGLIMLGYTVIFYALGSRKEESAMMMVGAVWGITGVAFPAFGLIGVHFYNKELGYSRRWVKWAFYALYPVMTLLLGIPYL
jgi:hypothetical protein